MDVDKNVKKNENFSYLPKILNGGIAGIVGVTCVFPIDLVKTRLQNQKITINTKMQYNGIIDCAKQTWQHGGKTTFSKIRSLYTGSSVNILLITPEKAIKLVANDIFRHKLANNNQKKLSTLRGMLAGGLAGFCQVVITTPMELLKIQMQQNSINCDLYKKKQTATALALSLIKDKGIAGLYKGITPTIARDVSFSVLYFPLFAQLDSLGPRKLDNSGDAVFYVSLLAGLSAGGIASFFVTPLDVIKTRIQSANQSVNIQYKSIFDTFLNILKHEGYKALFKGAGCRMMVMAPLFGIAQMIYFVGVGEYILNRKKTI